jgi:hypothetical protein
MKIVLHNFYYRAYPFTVLFFDYLMMRNEGWEEGGGGRGEGVRRYLENSESLILSLLILIS